MIIESQMKVVNELKYIESKFTEICIMVSVFSIVHIGTLHFPDCSEIRCSFNRQPSEASHEHIAPCLRKSNGRSMKTTSQGGTLCKYVNILAKLKGKYTHKNQLWFKCMFNNFTRQQNRTKKLNNERTRNTGLARPRAEEAIDMFRRIRLNEFIDDVDDNMEWSAAQRPSKDTGDSVAACGRDLAQTPSTKTSTTERNRGEPEKQSVDLVFEDFD